MEVSNRANFSYNPKNNPASHDQVHIHVRNLSKVYPNGTHAMDNVNVDIKRGEFVAIIGSSGAGKSTFIRSINRLVQPSRGEIMINGVNMVTARGNALRQLRLDVAMIFQQFNLIRRLTVLRNVLVGRLGYKTGLESIFPLFSKNDIDLALNSLDRLGIVEKAYLRADSLSGGQQQRVAIARALTQQPSIILADEPVASLDPEIALVVLDILRRINKEDGITTVVNLHQLDFAKDYADRILGFKAGRLIFDGPPSELDRGVYERIYK
jgi:phosphonate transport system ATP-binding protein